MVCSLALQRDSRPAFAVLSQPPAGRRRAFASPLLGVWAQQLRENRVTALDVEAAFAGLDRQQPPLIGADRILLQAGQHDGLARPERVEAVSFGVRQLEAERVGAARRSG